MSLPTGLPTSNLLLTDDMAEATDHILWQIAMGCPKIEVMDRATSPATYHMILIPRDAEGRAQVLAEQELVWSHVTALLGDDRVEAKLKGIFSQEAAS